MQMKDKTALVTGGAAGIGQEIVRRLAQEGAQVVSLDWNDAANQETAAAVCDSGGDCIAVQGDVEPRATLIPPSRLSAR